MVYACTGPALGEAHGDEVTMVSRNQVALIIVALSTQLPTSRRGGAASWDVDIAVDSH